MARILNIETSTEVCSVSISEDGFCKDLLINIPTKDSGVNNGQHSKLLAVYIQDILSKNKYTAKDFDAVAISSGPGSYTGLRIGTSTAKGFCFGANIPLISVNTLQTLSEMAIEKSSDSFDVIIPMIDAKRMEVYTAIFDANNKMTSQIQAKIIDETSFNDLKTKKIIICGNGSEKCKTTLNSKNFNYLENIYPSAEFMCSIAEEHYNNNNFSDLVYFEPFYLKDFVTTTPKDKLANLLKQHKK